MLIKNASNYLIIFIKNWDNLYVNRRMDKFHTIKRKIIIKKMFAFKIIKLRNGKRSWLRRWSLLKELLVPSSCCLEWFLPYSTKFQPSTGLRTLSPALNIRMKTIWYSSDFNSLLSLYSWVVTLLYCIAPNLHLKIFDWSGCWGTRAYCGF